MQDFILKLKSKKLSQLVLAIRILSGSTSPVIYVDCNWVAHYLGRYNGLYMKKTVDAIYVLSHAGFKVVPVVDGTERHHSKVSTFTRRLERELDRVDVLKLWNRALSLSAQLKDNDSKKKIQ